MFWKEARRTKGWLAGTRSKKGRGLKVERVCSHAGVVRGDWGRTLLGKKSREKQGGNPVYWKGDRTEGWLAGARSKEG